MTTTTTSPRADLTRGLTLLADGPAGDAHATLCLARDVPEADPQESRAAALAAVQAAWAAGEPDACVAALAAARPVLARSAVGRRPDPAGDYVDGMLALLTGDPGSAAPALGRAVSTCRGGDDGDLLLLAAAAALLLGDVEAACEVGARALAAARSVGDETRVARATEYTAYAELRAGRHALAREHALVGRRAAVRTGRSSTAAHLDAVLALAAAVQGPRADVGRYAGRALSTARRHGLAQPVTLAEWASARAELADGRPAEAAARLSSLLAPAGGAHFALRGLVLPTLVEAAVAAGDDAAGHDVVPELAAWSRSAADPQGPALLLRCRALLARGEETDDLFERAHAAHRECAGDFERARTLDLHGAWLRRRRRPVDARARLRDAVQLYERCGAEPWSRAVRAELRAAGAAPDRAPGGGAPPTSLAGLTPHQERIARCVAAGDTNREVAARLSVSVRTVDFHLRNVFVALGVRSRVELARRVAEADAPPP